MKTVEKINPKDLNNNRSPSFKRLTALPPKQEKARQKSKRAKQARKINQRKQRAR